METREKSVLLEVLTSPGCVHCHAFLEYWKAEGDKWPHVTMKEVSLITPEGQLMAGKYRILASPGIIINGELFDAGNFNKKELVVKLDSLSQ